jgi:hypothetical protein
MPDVFSANNMNMSQSTSNFTIRNRKTWGCLKFILRQNHEKHGVPQVLNSKITEKHEVASSLESGKPQKTWGNPKFYISKFEKTWGSLDFATQKHGVA